jgi:hypothetical protein
MSKKIDILDSLYNRTSSMVTVGGYNYDWSPKQSIGNGSLGVLNPADGALLSVQFLPESSSQEAGQAQYWLSMIVRIRGYAAYDLTIDSLDDVDYEVEKTRAALMDDLRRGFGLPWAGFCTAGGDDITYINEIDATENNNGDHIVEVCGEWRIKWRDSRI